MNGQFLFRLRCCGRGVQGFICSDCVNKNTMHTHYIAEIYSVKNQSWRTIHNIFSVCNNSLSCRHRNLVSLNGVIHFIAYKDREFGVFFKYFYLVDENFVVTPMPSKCEKHLSLNLHVLGDHVCIIGTFYKEISIWSPKQNGKTWNNIKTFPTFGSLIGQPGWYAGDVICVKENGNILCKMDGG